MALVGHRALGLYFKGLTVRGPRCKFQLQWPLSLGDLAQFMEALQSLSPLTYKRGRANANTCKLLDSLYLHVAF